MRKPRGSVRSETCKPFSLAGEQSVGVFRGLGKRQTGGAVGEAGARARGAMRVARGVWTFLCLHAGPWACADRHASIQTCLPRSPVGCLGAKVPYLTCAPTCVPESGHLPTSFELEEVKLWCTT